jgi:hypothetical protein
MRPSVITPMPPRPGTAGIAPPSVAPAINEAMPDRWRLVPPASNGVVPPVAPASGNGAEAAPGAADPLQAPGAQSSRQAPAAAGAVIQTAPNEVIIPRTLSAPGGTSN